MTEVLCPLCDYRGSPRSVEAHVSGSRDDAHRGEVGRSYRDELREAAGPTPSAATTSETLGEPAENVAETDASEGIGIPSGWALVVATVLICVVVLATSTSSSSAPTDDADQPDQQEQEQEDADQDGPVVPEEVV